MKNVTDLSMLEISQYLSNSLKSKQEVSIVVKNPDCKASISLSSWLNLAELLYCKLLTPKIIDPNLVELTFKKLNLNNSFHTNEVTNTKEKYGTESLFFNINKLEHPSFLIAYKRALESVQVELRENILNLGINKGDEFELIKKITPTEQFNKLNLYGIDYSNSAIEYAKKSLNSPNIKLFTHDINAIDELNLPKMDLIISIGTLQSPNINYKPFLMKLTQEYLKPKSALILGFPNGRWIDGELIYGAKVKNYSHSELSLLFNDVIFAKKYLQQKKFKVTITGKEYIFITAIRR